MDTKWLEVLTGKEDAARMKDCVVKIMSKDEPVEEKITAFDELELLVESLDNANDLRPLKLWDPIISILTNSLEPQLRLNSLWVLGTAVQNNPQTQQDFLDVGGLPPVLHALQHDENVEVRLKALRCISGAIKNEAVFASFRSLDGFSALSAALRDGDPALLKRALHLYRALIVDDSSGIANATVSHIENDGVAEMALEVVTGDGGEDADLLEKFIGLMTAIATTFPGKISPELSQRIVGEILPTLEKKVGTDDETVDGESLSSLRSALKA